MKLFLALLITSSICFAQDLFGPNPLNETRPLQFETPSRQRQRAIAMSQRAFFTYPIPRRIRKNVQQRIDQVVGKELMATLGAFYIGINRKEVSTRYVRNLTIPFQGGTIRPDLGYQIEQKNTYYGLYFLKEIP